MCPIRLGLLLNHDPVRYQALRYGLVRMPVDSICLLVLQLLEKAFQGLERLLELIFEP